MTEKKKPKRDYGDGSIYQRLSDKRWVGSLRLPDGKRKSVYGNTRNEAKKKLEEAKKKAEQGKLIASSKQTLTGFLDYWLTTIARSIEPSTVENYRNHTRRTRQVLGHIQIQRLTRLHIQQFVNGLNEAKLAPSTIHIIFSILDMAMDSAVKWKAIEANPCEEVMLPKLEILEKPILSPAQAKHLLICCEGQELEPFIALALGAGMRKGEICALRWHDVDMDKGLIHVERKVYPLRHPDGKYRMTEGAPKSKSSRRVIPLAHFVKEALLRHRRSQREHRIQSAEWQDNDLVFCGPTGSFFDFTRLRVHFKKLLITAELPDIPIHALRHSCNTLLRLMGVDAVTRQRILGHAKVDVTENMYGHTFDELKQDAMEKLDRLFSDDDRNQQAN